MWPASGDLLLLALLLHLQVLIEPGRVTTARPTYSEEILMFENTTKMMDEYRRYRCRRCEPVTGGCASPRPCVACGETFTPYSHDPAFLRECLPCLTMELEDPERYMRRLRAVSAFVEQARQITMLDFGCRRCGAFPGSPCSGTENVRERGHLIRQDEPVWALQPYRIAAVEAADSVLAEVTS